MRRIEPPKKYTNESLRDFAGPNWGVASYQEAYEVIEDLANDLLNTRTTLAAIEETGWRAIVERDEAREERDAAIVRAEKLTMDRFGGFTPEELIELAKSTERDNERLQTENAALKERAEKAERISEP